MKLTPWQPLSFRDRLVELGPSQTDVAGTTYAYLEFEDKGRVLNVTAMADLVSKLNRALGGDHFEFHLVTGQNVQTSSPSAMLVALGEPQGVTYAVDMRSRGLDQTLAGSRQARRMGRLLQFFGAGITLLGIPLMLAIIGFPMLVGGVLLWRHGKRIATTMQYQIELLETQAAMLGRLSGVRLL